MLNVGLFLRTLVRMLAFLDGWNVPMNGLTQIMNDAHFENLKHVHADKLVREGHSHQAQSPCMFGGAFRSAR